jgi:hypothetical protein
MKRTIKLFLFSLFSLVLLASLLNVRSVNASTIITVQVNSSSDDVWVYDTNDRSNPPWDGICTNIVDAYLGYDGVYTTYSHGSGFRFTNVAVPQGAVILSAYLQLESIGTKSGTPVNLRIACENSDNAATFSTVDDYNSRPRTSYVNWSNVEAWNAFVWYNSPDISSIIQQVINRAGWQSGNSIAIFVEDDGTSVYERVACTYDNNPTYAAKLVIEYTVPPSWHSVESWNGVLHAIGWYAVESWTGSIIGKCFNFVEVWRGVFPELPMFYVRSVMLYVGLGGLFCFMPLLGYAGKKRSLILLFSAFVLLILSWALLYIVSVTTNY